MKISVLLVMATILVTPTKGCFMLQDNGNIVSLALKPEEEGAWDVDRCTACTKWNYSYSGDYGYYSILGTGETATSYGSALLNELNDVLRVLDHNNFKIEILCENAFVFYDDAAFVASVPFKLTEMKVSDDFYIYGLRSEREISVDEIAKFTEQDENYKDLVQIVLSEVVDDLIWYYSIASRKQLQSNELRFFPLNADQGLVTTIDLMTLITENDEYFLFEKDGRVTYNQAILSLKDKDDKDFTFVHGFCLVDNKFSLFDEQTETITAGLNCGLISMFNDNDIATIAVFKPPTIDNLATFACNEEEEENCKSIIVKPFGTIPFLINPDVSSPLELFDEDFRENVSDAELLGDDENGYTGIRFVLKGFLFEEYTLAEETIQRFSDNPGCWVLFRPTTFTKPSLRTWDITLGIDSCTLSDFPVDEYDRFRVECKIEATFPGGAANLFLQAISYSNRLVITETLFTVVFFLKGFDEYTIDGELTADDFFDISDEVTASTLVVIPDYTSSLIIDTICEYFKKQSKYKVTVIFDEHVSLIDETKNTCDLLTDDTIELFEGNFECVIEDNVFSIKGLSKNFIDKPVEFENSKLKYHNILVETTVMKIVSNYRAEEDSGMSKTVLAVIIVAACVVACLVVAVVLFFLLRKKRPETYKESQSVSTEYDSASNTATVDEKDAQGDVSLFTF